MAIHMGICFSHSQTFSHYPRFIVSKLWPTGQIHPAYFVFVNKAVLEYSRVLPFMHCLWMFLCDDSRAD
jgi:hypothetical protein